MNTNIIISGNIVSCMKAKGKKQAELAVALDTSRQIVCKMLNGARAINAMELKKIAEFCDTSMESLVQLPEKQVDIDVVRVFMGKVKSEEARKGIEYADELMDLFLFHKHVNDNVKEAMNTWSDLV